MTNKHEPTTEELSRRLCEGLGEKWHEVNIVWSVKLNGLPLHWQCSCGKIFITSTEASRHIKEQNYDLSNLLNVIKLMKEKLSEERYFAFCLGIDTLVANDKTVFINQDLLLTENALLENACEFVEGK